MKRRPLATGLCLLAAVPPALAAVREVPAIEASVGAPAAPAASIGSAPSLSLAPVLGAAPAFALSAAAPAAAPLPALAPPLAAPAALPATPLAAASDGPRYEAGAPPDAEHDTFASDKPDGLKQLRNSLTARGETRALEMADKLYYTDPLTGLPNRAYYLERGGKAMEGVVDSAVALLDMNNFGVVNAGLTDVHGVVKGRERADAVLAVAGSALASLARKKGVVVARLGGEEFVVLGPREKVLEFSGEARRMMPPEKLLRAAGIDGGGAEHRAIAAAQERLQRGGQPVGDFTYGVASANGLAPAAALAKADGALNAAKAGGRRGVVSVANADGTSTDWAPPPSDVPAPELPSAREVQPTVEAVAELEARLTPHEKALFREAAFRDPLTLTRSYDYVNMRAAEWDRTYASGGMVVISSARNLKQINDLLGHEAGDRYLRRLGVILRQEIIKARKKRKLDVQEPVRVASKEFLLVGKDAKTVADLAAQAVAKSFDGGRMLTPDEVKRLRAKVGELHLAPPERVSQIGTLRVIAEPIDAGGHADSKAALDRAFVRLEAQKRDEDGGTTTVKLPFSAN
jgi:GGDEF domain-containing protein